MIRVKYYGILKKYMPAMEDDGYWHCTENGCSVRELLTRAGADPDSVGMTVLVNRVRKDKDYVLSDGDTVTVMPLVAGG